MRKTLIASLVVAAGCMPSRTTLYGTPPSTNPTVTQLYPAVVDYEILGSASARACGELQELALVGAGRGAGITGGVAHPALYEAAKYQALEQLPGADNLMFVRMKVENEGYDQCVTVTGRGYRVVRLHTGTTDDGHAPLAGAPIATPPAEPIAPPAAPATPPPEVTP